MNIIKQNPFRVLGLLGNSTERELQKQIGIIKRYAEIGKSKSFDYDFETTTSSLDVRSYVFRRFAISEEVNAIVTKQSTININYKFEIEENGKLNWDKWTEILLMNRKNHWFRLNLNYKLANNISISPGLIFFKRTEDKINSFNLGSGLAGQKGDLFSYGPTLKINYALDKNLEFNFEGMRRVINRSGMDKSFINFFNLRLAWYR